MKGGCLERGTVIINISWFILTLVELRNQNECNSTLRFLHSKVSFIVYKLTFVLMVAASNIREALLTREK